MIVGITGTRFGCKDAQLDSLQGLLIQLAPTEFHHGDCVGVDDEGANTIKTLNMDCDIICHPPVDTTHRANNPHSTKVLPAKTHFARNRDIVDSCEVLIVCPFQPEHQSSGGTWYTYDYAMKHKKPTIVIWPDGVINTFNKPTTASEVKEEV